MIAQENREVKPFEQWVSRGVARHRSITWLSLISKHKINVSDEKEYLDNWNNWPIYLWNDKEILLDNMTGKDIYCKLIMLRTGSGDTVPQIAKYRENPERRLN